MGRFELDPIDTSFHFIETKPLQRFCHAPVHSVPSITLGHDHKIGIDLVFCVHRRAVPRDGFLTGNDGNAGRQRAPLLLQRLVVEAQTREACFNRLPRQAAHSHDAAVAGIAVENHGNFHAARDPLGDGDAFRHRENAEIREPGVIATGDTRADETGLDPIGFHDLRVKSVRGAENGENLIFSAQQLP